MNHTSPITIRLAALAALATFVHSSFAGTQNLDQEAPPILPAPAERAITGDATLAVLNQYNTRGIIVQDSGVTFQPSANLYFKVYEGTGFINKISLQLNLWSDVSTNNNVSSATSSSRRFTEFDFGGGFLIQFAKRFTLSSVYNKYTSPADGYPDGSFINNTLTFDDAGLLAKNFSIHPYFTFLYELPDDGQAGFAAHAWYFEPGIVPNYTFFADFKYPLNVALAAKFGLGDRFYGGNSYGYFAFGPQITVPLAFIPETYGKWTTSVGYRYYDLGDAATKIAPHGESEQHLFSAAVTVSF